MKERPILMAAGPVRNILAGRQTQDRRLVKSTPYCGESGVTYAVPDSGLERWGIDLDGQEWWWPRDSFDRDCDGSLPRWKCPYGQPGDILRVRETARVLDYRWRKGALEALLRYEADGFVSDWLSYPDRLASTRIGNCIPNGCYLEACRLLLQITDIRVERLQDISEGDAIAEGVRARKVSCGDTRCGLQMVSVKQAFSELWESCYGPGSWDANPWLWVIDFKKLEVSK